MTTGVTFNWNDSGAGYSYVLEHSFNQGGPFTLIASNLTGNNYTDNTIVPFSNWYRLSAVYNDTIFLTQTDPVLAWRAVTDVEFYFIYYQTISNAEVRPGYRFDSTGGWNTVGDVSGTITKTVNMGIPNVTVPIVFVNYADFNNCVLDGTLTTVVNWLSQDGNLNGAMQVSGFYSGWIWPHLIITGGAQTGGDIDIFQTGGTTNNWTWSALGFPL